MTMAAELVGRRLTVPAGYRAHWLSDPGERERVEGFTSASPERTVYHAPSYIEFARGQNGHADLLWLTLQGAPALGLPVHPVGRLHLGTGYSGILAAAGRAGLKRGVAALVALLAANRRLGLDALQCVQAPAYAEPARHVELACLLAAHGLRCPPLYARVLALEPLDCDRVEAPMPGEPRPDELRPDERRPDELCPDDVRPDDLRPDDLGLDELLLGDGLRPYEAALRSQIRQALRHGLSVTCALPRGDRALPVYRRFAALHAESWRRTGLTPHPLSYWAGLGQAVVDGGGHDLVVFAHEPDGTPVAAVSCHLSGERALYWAGASSERGLATRANPLCLHAAVQACRRLGVRHFELGRFHARERSPKERSVTRYKTQFGGELVGVVSFRTHPSPVAVVLRSARPPRLRLSFRARRSGGEAVT